MSERNHQPADTEFDEMVLDSIGYLQEFYDNTIMHKFFHECDEQDCDAAEAFLHLRGELGKKLASGAGIPSFTALAGEYAKAKGWVFSASTIFMDS